LPCAIQEEDFGFAGGDAEAAEGVGGRRGVFSSRWIMRKSSRPGSTKRRAASWPAAVVSSGGGGGREEGGRELAGAEGGKVAVEERGGGAGAEEDLAGGEATMTARSSEALSWSSASRAHGEFFFDGFLERADFEVGADAGEDFGEVNGFDDVDRRRRRRRRGLFRRARKGGHEDDREVAVPGIGFELGAGGEAVEDGHHHIEEDEVGGRARDEVEGGAAVGGDEEFVAGVGEGVEEEGDVGERHRRRGLWRGDHAGRGK